MLLQYNSIPLKYITTSTTGKAVYRGLPLGLGLKWKLVKHYEVP